MKIICPQCESVVGDVDALARLILTVHCPYDGHDFGVAVDPLPAPASVPASSDPAPTS
jgi:hypothetical protein